MYPSRAAPAPPSGAALPPNHPFATYYLPPQHFNGSVSSLATSAPASPTSIASSSRRARSPTASLAAPLSPHRANSYPSTSRQPIRLPADLSLFDPKPRQTLLDDLEFIAGKRLSFPFINKLMKAKAEKKEAKEEKREKRVLRKDRDPKWEQDFAWEGVKLLDEKKSEKGANWV